MRLDGEGTCAGVEDPCCSAPAWAKWHLAPGTPGPPIVVWHAWWTDIALQLGEELPECTGLGDEHAPDTSEQVGVYCFASNASVGNSRGR